MRISPSVMSSSPAIIRSAVVFPQPDGPTRITNSPSAMSRFICLTASVPSGYRFVTLFRTISATAGALALDRAGGEAGDDPLLEDEHEHDQRHGDDDRGRADRPERDLELRAAGEERDRRGNRADAGRRGERDREQELVPDEDEGEQPGRDETGCRERQHDLGERLEVGRAVDERGLLELARDVAEERGADVDRERKRESEVREDQPPV